MVPNMYRMRDSLLAHGFSNAELRFLNHADGQHSEWYWAREFPACFEWLFQNTVLSSASEEVTPWFLSGGAGGRFSLHGRSGHRIQVTLTDLQGRQVYAAEHGSGEQIKLPGRAQGILLARFGTAQDSMFQKVLVY